MQSLETETEILRDRDETWDLRDRHRDLKKRVSRRVSRPRPSLETPSLLSYISKRIFNGTGFSNEIIEKNVFLTMHLPFMLFSLQFHNSPQCLVWKCFKQCINVRFVNRVYSPMLSISKLTYFKWKTITAVFNVNGGVFLNSKKMMRLAKCQFYMLCIYFWSEYLSVQSDGICFSTVVFSVWTSRHNQWRTGRGGGGGRPPDLKNSGQTLFIG